jgi:DNA-binding CsgD family transcriptional regulator/tetratricopeptide (TPR) repeat protein
MAAPVAFVGREGELSRLLAALGGDVRLVLVVGDAGVGKSRFAGEGMARAAAAGVVMVRGECLPLAETLPLQPVAAALDELVRLDGGKMVRAALDAVPGYVREEVARLVPALATDGGPGLAEGLDQGWRRGRLFSAVAELLDAAAGSWTMEDSQPGIGLVIEDVHWADGATLDLLTFLVRGGRHGAVRVVATCRGDEAPAAHVAEWLAEVRGAAGVEEIRLPPLTREEVAGQVTALAGSPVAAGVVDELYARAEGNPFFTEQLVAAALADSQEVGGLRVAAGLPGRLADLLAARSGRCTGEARAVLAGLAVAGRPLAEDLLTAVTGLDAGAVREGLRELAAVRLLAEDTAGNACRPRHALLAEAVAGGLVPGERAALHERAARALAAAGGETLTAEVAGHWQAASRPAEELPARVAAAEAAERVFGYAEAAVHWQRAIALTRARTSAADVAGIDVLALYLRAVDALEWSGMGIRAGEVAEEAYRRLGGHPDPATAAVVRHRAAIYRAIEDPAAGLALVEEALRLFEQTLPSAEHAQAWLDHAGFLQSGEGRLEGISPALTRALEIAEAAGATALTPRILASLAANAFRHGQIGEAFAFLERGWALARDADDGVALLRLALTESDALLNLARFPDAAEVALTGLGTAREGGLHASFGAVVLAFNASQALLASGRTAEAAALVDPMTQEPPDRNHWPLHEARAELDLLRGEAAAAATRRQQIDAIPGHLGSAEFAADWAQRGAELALWAGHHRDALSEVQRVLALLKDSDLAMFCGRLLTTGMRACADLAEQARSRRNEPGLQFAVAAADSLVSWADQQASGPFSDHPFIGTTAAERATWDAERARLAGGSDPAAWHGAAKTWEGLGCPHRAGYARWRQAQAQLDGGQPVAAAGAALRAAAAAADGHAPLVTQIRQLAERARIPIQAAAGAEAPPPARTKALYGLTGRELAVLRLLATGRTNAQIGAELYISPSTASVHVSNILRKLGASGRTEAAAIAERAGLLAVSDSKPRPAGN